MDLQALMLMPDLQEVERSVRREYLRHRRSGLTLEEMSVYSELPFSTMAAWLQGTRRIVKLHQLQKALRGLKVLESMAVLL